MAIEGEHEGAGNHKETEVEYRQFRHIARTKPVLDHQPATPRHPYPHRPEHHQGQFIGHSCGCYLHQQRVNEYCQHCKVEDHPHRLPDVDGFDGVLVLSGHQAERLAVEHHIGVDVGPARGLRGEVCEHADLWKFQEVELRMLIRGNRMLLYLAIMDPEISSYVEDDDFDIFGINSIPTNVMEDLSNNFRLVQRPSSLQLKRHESMEFSERLNLDMLIDSMLQNLLKAKIAVMEISEEGLIVQSVYTSAFIQYFSAETKKYLKTLLLRQAQLGSLVYLLDHRGDPDFKQRYVEQYEELGNFVIKLEDSYKLINFVVLQESFQAEMEFLREYCDMIELIKLSLVHKKYVNDLNSLTRPANQLKIINSKIATIAEIFPYACILDRNDLFSCKKTSERWKRLLDRWIRHKFYGEKQQIKQTFTDLKNGLNIVNATMSVIHEAKKKKDWGNLMKSTNKILKIMTSKKDAENEAKMLFSDPNQELAKQIWNLPEQKLFRNLIATVLPSIAMSEEFWIPRIFTQFLASGGAIDVPELTIENLVEYKKALSTRVQHDVRLQMRINSPYPLEIKLADGVNRPNSNSWSSWLNPLQWGAKKPNTPMAVIYHIHGGGFISMSSFIHQTYTRNWANNLKVPIISVDYGKAPEYPFPNGLYDCFEGYMWLLYCFRQVYEAEPVKVILVGDSAGGNLVAALTNLLIQLKLRTPDGLCMVYPALNLNYQNYTPSLLTSLNDMILPHTFLKICLKAYLPEGVDAVNDPLISPIKTPEEVLKKYPPTRIFVGSKDPFHDDCCRLTENLNNCKQDLAKLTIFEEFPHGFLQFDVKTQPHEQCRKATKEVEMALYDLLTGKSE